MDDYFYSFAENCKKNFGRRLFKVALDAGMTCPVRDGKIDTRGCIFCDAGGSGDFAEDPKKTITQQIRQSAKKRHNQPTKPGSDFWKRRIRNLKRRSPT